MRVAMLLCVALAGCAVTQHADGERVSIRHEGHSLADLQAQADKACIASGGRAPAKFVSEVPIGDILPAALTPKLANFRCS
jgi:hypothetical protein